MRVIERVGGWKSIASKCSTWWKGGELTLWGLVMLVKIRIPEVQPSRLGIKTPSYLSEELEQQMK